MFRLIARNRHNYYRAIHDSPKLDSNQILANSAQKWARQLAKTRKFQYSNGSIYGENIFIKYSNKNLTKETCKSNSL